VRKSIGESCRQLDDMVEAVFFDIGDTLVAPHPSFAALFAETCRCEGVPLSDAAARPVEAWVGRELASWRAEGRLFSASPESSRQFWQGLYARFLTGLGIPFPAALPERIYQRFTQSDSYRAFPDVIPSLRALRERGLRLAVLSNWEEWLERLLHDLDLLPFFDLIVVSGVEGREKPDPALFQLALTRVGVLPQQAVHVGDSLESDCAPALAAGMHAILLDRCGRHPDTPYPRITDLEGLLDVLNVSSLARRTA
jgi:REG-2-like HAD superfamily hydrolase